MRADLAALFQPDERTARPLTVEFRVFGAPQGARRHRVARRGANVVAYHGSDHVTAEERLRAACLVASQGARFAGPVMVHVRTVHARPARLRRRADRCKRTRYTGKPDADNVAKLVMDACTLAGVWRDDTCVATLVVERWYAHLDEDGDQELPHTFVCLASVPEQVPDP